MSVTPTDEEIRRRLERQVIDEVLDRLTLGESRRDVIDALVADGFDRQAAGAYVDRVIHSPEGRAARKVARPVGRRAPYVLPGLAAGLVVGLGLGAVVPMALLGATIGWLAFEMVGRSGPDDGATLGAPRAMAPATRATIPTRPDDAIGLFLRDALERRLIDLATYERLDAFRPRSGEAAPPAAAVAGPAVSPPAAPRPDVEQAAPPHVPTGVRVPAPVAAAAGETARGPSPVELRLRALRDLVVSDIAVHGLTYLGALLLFAGAFGFVLFSFGSVRVGLRPVAELGVPSLLLGSAWYLRRRGAPFVATALGLVGGVLLPIFLFGSFVDGVGFPPDLTRTPLLATLVLVSLATAGGYAAYARIVPEASVRYLVVPSLWLAAWSAGLAFDRFPDGTFSLQRWSAPQMAAVAVAVAISAVVLRLRPSSRLAEASRPAIVPGIAIAYGLVLATAAGDGWPAGPIVVAGVAALAVTECVRAPAGVVSVLQPFVAGVTVLALGPVLGVDWTGALAAALFVGMLEWHLYRRGGSDGSAVGSATAAAGIVLGIAAASIEPWPAVTAFGVASLWVHLRRLRPAALRPAEPVLLVAAVALPIGAGTGLVTALPDGVAVIGIAAIVATAAAAVRRWTPRDDFYDYWLPGVAAAAALLSFSPTVDPAPAAAAAGLVAIAFVVSPGLLAVRAWGGAAAIGWAGWSAAQAFGIGSSGRALVLGAAGAALVGACGLLRRPLDGHLGGAGIVSALIALVLPSYGQVPLNGWSRTGVLAAVVASAVASACWAEIRDAGPVGTIAAKLSTHGRPRLAGAVRTVPIVAAAIGVPFLALDLVDLERRSWNGIVVSSVGLAEAAVARLLVGRRPQGDAAAIAAFATAAVGISVAAPDPWPVIVTLAALVATTRALGGSLRRSAMTWIAWIASVALLVLLVGRAGVPPRDLWIPAFAWGAVAMIGGLLVDELRTGPRASGDGVRSSWLWPPVALGALAMPGALAFAFTGTPLWYGRWSLAAAVVYVVVARQLRAGSIATATCALVTVAIAALSGVSIVDDPIALVPWSAGLVALSELVRRSSPHRDLWARWDIGPIVVGHGAAIIALALAVPADAVAPVWAACGLLAIALGVARRTSARGFAAWSLGGSALVLVAATVAGPGWLALTCSAVAVAAIVVATRTAPPLRHVAQGVAVVAAGAAWSSFLVWSGQAWSGWSTARSAVTTASLGAALLLGPAIALRLRRLTEDWTFSAWALGATCLASAVVLAFLPDSGMTSRQAGLLAAASLGVAAIAIGLTASRLDVRSQRELATGLGVLAVCQLGVALDTPPVPAATVAAAAGLLAIGAWIALWRLRPRSPWIPSAILVSFVGDAASLPIAASVLPRGEVLEVALLLTGVECATAGVILRRTHLVAASPLFPTIAWLVYASEAFRGEIQWYTVPSGIALLVLVSIERRGRERAGRAPRTPELLAIEYAGMTSIVAVSLVEIVTISPLRGLIAIGLGIVVGGWGALTHVRRRASFGACTVALAVILLLGVPIADLVPAIHGPALWLVLAGAGVAFILVATMLERGRTKVREVLRRLDDLTRGWE